MSDEEQSNNEEEDQDEEEEEDEEQNDEEEDEDGDEEEDEENQDQDQEEDGESKEEEDEDEEQDDSKADTQNQDQNKKDFLPTFKVPSPDKFQFTNLLSQISSLSLGVDNFISSLPSHGGQQYRSYYVPPPVRLPPLAPQIPPVREESRVVIMKDEDTQVSMQPQIVIQPTKIQKPPAEQTFKMSNESNKFLAQLYEENKKLKRWQNSSQPVNSYQPGSSVGSGFYGSRQRYQRQQYEKGLFNVEERNKEIDEAIEVLKRQQNL